MRWSVAYIGFTVLVVFACSKTETTSPEASGILTGTWAATFLQTGAESVSATLTIEQKDDSLAGTFAKPGKNAVPFQEGYTHRDSVFIRFRSNLNADAPNYLYTLRGYILKAGQELQGTWWCVRGEGRWVAVRK